MYEVTQHRWQSQINLGVTKPLKISLISLITALSFSGLFVTGDYFGLFGLKKYLVLAFAEASFKTIDQETGAPIIDVKIRCFQKGHDNACTQKESHITGIVIARIPVQKLVWESLLFKNKEKLIPTNDPELHIMSIPKLPGNAGFRVQVGSQDKAQLAVND